MTREQFEAMKQIAASERIAAAVESLYENPAYIEAAINVEQSAQVLENLDRIERSCEAIVAAMPIFNTKTRQNRKWMPTQAYGYDLTVQAIIRICTGITYSANEHKRQMLAVTGLSDVLLAAVVDNLPSEPYYSRNYGVVVEGKEGNVQALAQAIQLVATQLGVVVPTTSLTPEFVRTRAEVARIKAERQAAEAQTSALLATDRVII